MIHRTTASVVVLLVASSAQLATAQALACLGAVPPDATPLDSEIVTAMREHGVPGAAIAIVRDGAVDRIRGYGCANLARGVTVDARTTVFRVASVSKPFVATATLIAAERGLVDLRADVNRYLRDVHVPEGWNRPITLHDLLTHTAGFEESIVGYAARTPEDVRPLGEFLAAKLPRRGWPAGDVTAYSNYGYALAGYVVESASRTPFAEFVRGEVLGPLGMSRSSFAHPLPPALERDLATSYRCGTDGCEAIPRDYRSAYPPGGLVTTADDMSRFLLAQLGDSVNGRRALSDSVLAMLRTQQFSHHSALPGLTYGFAEETIDGDRALTHAGGASGYTSFIAIIPGRRFGAFVVANGGSTRFGAAARDAIVGATLPAFAPASVARMTPAVASVDPAGAYRSTRYAHRGIENLPALFNGQLHVTRLRGDTIDVSGLGEAGGQYVPVAADRWRKVNDDDMIAVRTKDGAVTHLFGSQSYFGTLFPSAYERLAWYDEPHFLNEALSYTVVLPLLALVTWPVIAGVVWMVRRRRPVPLQRNRATPSAVRALAVAAAAASTAIAVWFGFGFIAASNRAAERGGGELVYGLPTTMRVLAWAPSVLAVLTMLLILSAVVGWRRRWWSVPGRLLYTVIAINVGLFVVILVRWGYFPVATG